MATSQGWPPANITFKHDMGLHIKSKAATVRQSPHTLIQSGDKGHATTHDITFATAVVQYVEVHARHLPSVQSSSNLEQ